MQYDRLDELVFKALKYLIGGALTLTLPVLAVVVAWQTGGWPGAVLVIVGLGWLARRIHRASSRLDTPQSRDL